MKRRNRKVMQLLIALVVLVMISGCGNPPPMDSESEPNTESTSVEPTGPSAPVEEESADGSDSMFDEQLASQLQSALEAAVASPDTNWPGAVLHISSPDLGEWTGAAGLGDPGTNTAMRPNDKFRGGSITKPFVSVLILQMAEEGLLSLDDTLPMVLPESVTSKLVDSDKITIRMLLNHSAGLPDFMDTAGPEIIANLDKVWTANEFFDFAATQEPWFAPGEAQAYSNTDYLVLGMVIEESGGRTWREELRARIFEPLQLENTLLPEPEETTIPGDFAHGYADLGGGPMDMSEIATASVVGAAGGASMVTNAEDMARFVSAVAASELFQESETLEEMVTPLDMKLDTPLGDTVPGYSLGLMHADFGGGIKGIGHSGDTPGYHTFAFYFPGQKLTISGAVNSDDYEAGFVQLIPRALEVLAPGYVMAEPSDLEQSVAAVTPPIVDAEGNEIPGSIAAIEMVTLNGFEQAITLRGVDATNPVLLFLHGGPGVPSSPWATWNNFQAELEQNFVVVHWDQRGVGKSFSEDLTADDMHMENFTADVLELTDLLRQNFGQEKIFLWGHSWGSALGFETLRIDAEPFHAYIASGVRPDWHSTQIMGYEWALEQAQQAGDSEAIQALEALDPFDPANLEHVGVRGEYLSRYLGGDFRTEGHEDAYLNYVLSGQSPEYPPAAIENTMAGIDFTRRTILLEAMQSGYDLFEDFPVSPIPVYFMAGRYDYETPAELAESYYNFLEAPVKNFTWFENSAHNIMYDEPDKTNQEVIRIAGEVLNP